MPPYPSRQLIVPIRVPIEEKQVRCPCGESLVIECAVRAGPRRAMEYTCPACRRLGSLELASAPMIYAVRRRGEPPLLKRG
jgi:hypothetical protein